MEKAFINDKGGKGKRLKYDKGEKGKGVKKR